MLNNLDDLERLIALMRANGVTHAEVGGVKLVMDHAVEMRAELHQRMREAIANPPRVEDPVDKLIRDRFPADLPE